MNVHCQTSVQPCKESIKLSAFAFFKSDSSGSPFKADLKPSSCPNITFLLSSSLPPDSPPCHKTPACASSRETLLCSLPRTHAPPPFGHSMLQTQYIIELHAEQRYKRVAPPLSYRDRETPVEIIHKALSSDTCSPPPSLYYPPLTQLHRQPPLQHLEHALATSPGLRGVTRNHYNPQLRHHPAELRGIPLIHTPSGHRGPSVVSPPSL